MIRRPLPDRRDSAATRPPAGRPAVEPLEGRLTPAAVFTVNDVSVVEGNTSTRDAQVTVHLTEPHGNSVTVDYRTADGTAGAGADYAAVVGKLTFAKNELTKTVLVPITGDRRGEPDESFAVNLSSPKGAKIADGTGLVTIAADEPSVYLTAGASPDVYNPSASVPEAVQKTGERGGAMDTKALGKFYAHLSPTERQPLIQAASLRGDEVESARLRRTAPMVGWRLPDYYGQADGLRNAALVHIIDCLDITAWMLRLNVQALDLVADPDEEMRDPAEWFAAAVRAYGYLLAAHRDGWHAFAEARRVDGDALLRLQPSYRTIELAERTARALAYTEAEMRA